MSRKIVQISDCHLFADRQKLGYKQINPAISLQNVVEEIADIDAELIIASGDISGDHSRLSYLHFIEILKHYDLVDNLITLPGNHDLNPYFGEVLGRFDLANSPPRQLGNWMIHGLDTRFQGTKGRHDQQSLQRIVQNIRRARKLGHVLISHHHPIDTNSWMDKHEWLNREQFLSQISSLESLQLVIYGHIHTDSTRIIDNVKFESCPSTCWQWAMTEEFGVTKDPPGYKVFELFDDLSFQSTTFRVT
ncbi:metallophosphoesterase family protein [Aliiglaciecola sp. M165]|uniref:metallophosphoesterase family protein n=1 Tax=Aliiglaciecola sp. M165 TaxID=2593649 RepID=UPI00117C31E8|nr:metallophosphoesterase [Aliiglaciecola sp. M165]TRY32916.1 hypothetical protein FM019_02700 [Aliiglaciecola sp. M165]